MIGSLNTDQLDYILEVGPGRGDLTHRLLHLGVPVTGIEIDRDLIQDLHQRFGSNDLFTLIEGDVLKTDWTELVHPGKENQIVSNLPYNISTPFFFKLIEHREMFRSITIMLQKELALRFCHDGTGKNLKDYGILSIVAAHTFDVKWITEVSASSFRPKPRVDSAIIQLVPRKPFLDDEKIFFGFVRSAFNARRKIFLTHLRKKEPEIFDGLSEDARQALGKLRPENLLPEQFLTLYRDRTL